MLCFSRILVVFKFYFSEILLHPKLAQLVCSSWHNICLRTFAGMYLMYLI